MSFEAARSALPATPKLSLGPVALLGLFASTILLSALLLFSVQPIFAKMVLPKLGGSPSVWAVSMCFFQAALLAGYCYAHLLNRWLVQPVALVVHLGLCGLAILALPFGLPAVGEPPAGDAYLWLVWVLALGVGLPFFAVSANAPLLQAWFARTGHRDAHDPYFLYGASNLGSLLALLSYPVLIEPMFGLSSQAAVWTAAFIALVVMIAASGLVAIPSASASHPSAPASERAAADDAPTWAMRLSWVGLALVPSGLLVAFTSFITIDIASAPLLWVIPLAAFLVTFMLVFRERPTIPHRWLLLVQPALVGITLVGLAWPAKVGLTIAVSAGSAAFFVTMLVCHRELYERRPASSRLTEFYLLMSLGGVIGGVLAAIVAPQVFNLLNEFPLLLVAGLACRPGALAFGEAGERRHRALAMLACGMLAVGILWAFSLFSTSAVGHSAPLLLVVVCGLLLIHRDDNLALLSLGLVAVVAFMVLPSRHTEGHTERSFFGVHRIQTLPNGEARLLIHGTTLHGVERLKDSDGKPIERPVPATYFHPGSPMALGFDVARGQLPAGRTLSAGVIGLGAGSLACYARSGEAWRFYEIDPSVVRIARDPAHFSFLSKCLPNADIVLGDARLTLSKEPAGRYDYLVVDAFSSDAVPAHLITREAVELYLDKVGPDGLIVLHISNRHLDLPAVGSAIIASLPGVRAVLVNGKGEIADYNLRSQVLFLSRSERAIGEVSRMDGASALPAPVIQPWTDEQYDVLSVLWRKRRVEP